MRSKTIIIILVTLLTLALAAVAFLIGMMLASDKKAPPVQPAAIESAEGIDTEPPSTSVETSATTEAATTATTAAETTAAATTTALPKPTITNAYMFYHNTGSGCKLYLHVEGDYAGYQYQVHFKSPADTQYSVTNKGESKETEFLIAEGLSDFGIESYKASVTAWNADKSESAEQWAYMNNAACEDDTVVAVEHGDYLFSGYVMTKTDTLNLRARPDENSKSLNKIPKSTKLDLYDSGTSGWYWTEYNGTKGYVSAKYVKDPYDNTKMDVYYTEQSCLKYGRINTHGTTVPGYTLSRIQPNGDTDSTERASLGNGWHIVAYQYMINPEATYYELYDSQDGDYYGWVDSAYIDWDS